MNHVTYFKTDEHEMTCTIYSHGKTFVGTARCNPVDYDMETDKVAQTISYSRAMKKYYSNRIRVLHERYMAYVHLYDIFLQSKDVNLKSYESYLLRRQIKTLKREMGKMRQDLEVLDESLKTFLDSKNFMYEAIRKNRTK